MERDKLVKLVTEAQKGDSKSMNLLFNEFYNDVYYFALKTVKNEDIACDVTQETFVEIIKTLNNLKEPAAFVTWMKQIAYHQCTRYFKKKKDILVDEDENESTVFDTVKEDRADFIPDEALDQQGFKEIILGIVDGLSEEQRSAIMMYYFDELSVKEIAEIQGVSESTVKSRLNYGRKAIKKSVEEYEEKNGIKLHAIPFFPFFKWLFKEDSKAKMPAAAAKSVAKGVSKETKTTVRLLSGAGAAAKAAAIPLAAKVVAGVIAVTVVAGGVAAAVLLTDKEPAPKEEVSTTVLAEAVTESTTEIAEEIIPEDETTAEEKTEVATTEPVTEEITEAVTAPVVDEDELLSKAESYGRSIHNGLPYFNNVSELSALNVADFLYYKIDDNYEKTYIDDSSYSTCYTVDIPVSDFEKHSKEWFGRTYNFREIDGGRMSIDMGEGVITYNKSQDTLNFRIGTIDGWGDVCDYTLVAEKIDDTNYVVRRYDLHWSDEILPPGDSILDRVYVSDNGYYYFDEPVEEIRLVLVDGEFQVKSYVKVAD